MTCGGPQAEKALGYSTASAFSFSATPNAQHPAIQHTHARRQTDRQTDRQTNAYLCV